LRPAARRILSIAAAAAAGLAASLVLASPASAHHIDIGVSKTCQQDGTWKVTWTVNNSEDDLAGKVTAVALTPAGTTVSNIVVDAVLPADGSLVGTQIVPGDAAGATISVTVHWNRDGQDHSDTKSNGVEFTYKCESTYTVAQTCDSITFTFKAPPAPVVPASAPLTDTGVYLAGAALTSSSIKLHPSVGSDVTFTLNSGDPDKVVSFPGSPGLTVVVTIDNFEKTHTFTHDPCPTTPSPSPSLATTGSSLSSPLGIGAALVLVGIGLIAALFMFRRRRTVAGSLSSVRSRGPGLWPGPRRLSVFAPRCVG
jgi:hypothetical protein